jgi:hypothetical protein
MFILFSLFSPPVSAVALKNQNNSDLLRYLKTVDTFSDFGEGKTTN